MHFAKLTFRQGKLGAQLRGCAILEHPHQSCSALTITASPSIRRGLVRVACKQLPSQHDQISTIRLVGS